MKLKDFKEYTMISEAKETLTLSVPKEVLKMNDLFKKAGHELYIVGGAVRDAVLGIRPKDWDLATDAQPEKIKKILHKYKFKEIGEQFAIVFVIAPDGEEYEIATFREDIGKGRRPDAVKFSTIDKDVLRRDLTINALFYDIDKKEVVDLVGGIADLESLTIKSVGDPLERFGEDALRKLRAIRFAAKIGGKLDKDVHEALMADNSLPEVSFPRIRDEFQTGITKSKSAAHYLSLVEQYNFWDGILPGIKVNKKFINSSNWKVQLAQLLIGNEIDKKFEKNMKTKYAYTDKELNSVRMMFSLLNFSLENDLMNVLKLTELAGVEAGDVMEFAKYNSIDKNLVKGLFKHKVTTQGNDPELKGLKGSEIGDGIVKIEAEKFKNKWL